MLLSRPRPACLGRLGPSRWSRNLSGQAARSSARNVGPAEAVVATINAAELSGTLSYRDHLIRIGLWSLVSLNVGAYFSQGDDGAQVLLHLDEFTTALLESSTERTVLETALERLSRGLSLNDTLKLRLLATPGLVSRLIELSSTTSASSTTARNHAVKVIEALSSSAEAQRELVAQGHHVALIEVMRRESAPLYVRKALASTVCNLAACPDNVPALGRAGAVGALLEEQSADVRLQRQKVAASAARLALGVRACGAPVLDELSATEREEIERLATAEEAAAAASPLHAVRASLVESGVLLYFHTAGGGAAWGLFESLRLGQSRAMLVQNVARTALVTCFVPILMVGGVVTAYTRVNRTTDEVSHKFALYFSLCALMYPASRLLAWVERFAPLWLGGHVVGFGSFFAWTLHAESDLLKSDRDLLAPAPKKKRQVPLFPAPAAPAGAGAAAAQSAQLWQPQPAANAPSHGPSPLQAPAAHEPSSPR